MSDFWLSEPAPWKTPVGGLSGGAECPGLPPVRWDGADRVVWDEVFQAAHDSVTAGVLSKIVPAIEEAGEVGGEGGDAAAFISHAGGAGGGLWGYGFDDGQGRGFAGASPEVFLHIRGNEAEAMALAGSGAPGGEPLGDDAKERTEHAHVADDIAATLSAFGDVSVGEREVLDLGDIRHLMTRVRCRVNEFGEGGLPQYGRMIRALHPTPAVGTAPRSPEGDQLLRQLRGGRCPDQFGAPFGLLEGDEFFAVLAIRGVFWGAGLGAGSTLSLPAGCGIVGESTCDREWEELALKRATVKTFFGMG